jgi:hypothetical protein
VLPRRRRLLQRADLRPVAVRLAALVRRLEIPVLVAVRLRLRLQVAVRPLLAVRLLPA